MDRSRTIGGIGNYYGGLAVKEDEGKFYWGIMDYNDNYDWEEIPKSLYDELIEFQDEGERIDGVIDG